MGTAVEDARAKVEETKQAYEEAMPLAVAVFEDAVEAAINKMIELTVLDQPERTKSLDAGILKSLKIDIASSIKNARAQVGPAFNSVRRQGFADTSLYEAPNKILSPLLKEAGDLIQAAGFDVRPLKASAWDKGYRISRSSETGKAVDAARDLDLARTQYTMALTELKQAEEDVARGEARSAWENA